MLGLSRSLYPWGSSSLNLSYTFSKIYNQINNLDKKLSRRTTTHRSRAFLKRSESRKLMNTIALPAIPLLLPIATMPIYMCCHHAWPTIAHACCHSCIVLTLLHLATISTSLAPPLHHSACLQLRLHAIMVAGEEDMPSCMSSCFNFVSYIQSLRRRF